MKPPRSPHHHHHHDHQHDLGGLAEVLDLDAVVMAEPMRGVRRSIEAAADAPVRRILDVGAGTGTGTIALLQHFEGSTVVALDASEEMLTHLRRRADGLGLADRVEARLADLDDEVPEVEPVDLLWASASLHHLADPDRTLDQLVAVLRLGGLLAVVEMAGQPRFLRDGAPGSAGEAAVHALVAQDRHTDMPTMGGDWGPRLTRAGLQVEEARTIEVELTPPLAPEVGAYAAAVLSRMRLAVGDRLGPSALRDLESLLDGGPADVRRREDLGVRGERHLWIARRPT